MQLPRTVAEFKHYTDSYLAERDLGWERVVLNLDALDDSLFPSGKPVWWKCASEGACNG